MSFDEETDARIRVLTRRVVESAPLPPELDLDGGAVRRAPAGGRRRAVLVLAAASVLVVGLALSLSRRADPQAVQAGSATVALERVELPGGGLALQTPGLPPMVAADPVGSRDDARCLTPAGGGGLLCALADDRGIGLSLSTTDGLEAVLVSVPTDAALVEITIDGTTVRQRPLDGVALLDVSAMGLDVQRARIEVIVLDEAGIELTRTALAEPAPDTSSG